MNRALPYSPFSLLRFSHIRPLRIGDEEDNLARRQSVGGNEPVCCTERNRGEAVKTMSSGGRTLARRGAVLTFLLGAVSLVTILTQHTQAGWPWRFGRHRAVCTEHVPPGCGDGAEWAGS